MGEGVEGSRNTLLPRKKDKNDITLLFSNDAIKNDEMFTAFKETSN